MEITLNVKLSASPELVHLISGILGKTQLTVTGSTFEDDKAIKELKQVASKEKKAEAKPAAKEKASENGVEVDLSTIRQYLAKSEDNKAAARKLLHEFGVEKLTDLDKKDFVAFYAKLTATEKDDL